MAVSLLSSARTDRTRPSFASQRTLRWGRSSALRKETASSFTVERQLDSHEQQLVDSVWNFIEPALNDSSDPFHRPWPRAASAAAVRPEVGDLSGSIHDIETSLSSFIGDLAPLLSLPYSGEVPSPQSASLRAMAIRPTGQTFQAACMLREVIDSNEECPDIVRLHYADALSALRVHDRQLDRPGRQVYIGSTVDTAPVDTVQAALDMYTQCNNLYAALTDIRFIPATQETMLRAPLEHFTLPDIFAMICYCHSIVTCFRYASTMQLGAQKILADPHGQALTRLLQIGQHLSSDDLLPGRSFLIWRCSQALRVSVPFHKPLPGLFPHGDALSLFIGEAGDPEPEHVAVLRCWRAGDPLQAHELHVLADYLALLIDKNDLSALDDALFAVQLIDHPDLIDLRRSFRRLSWKLHSELMPSAPWVLDYMLLHPLALWVGMSARNGRKFLSMGHLTESSTVEFKEHHFQHLQFGFGSLKGRDKNAAHFVYAWSILYQCLQYTPAPLEDALYHLLFLDADIFSWSQLCRRLRQVCESQQHPPSAPKVVSINGTTQQHAYFAGLRTVEQLYNEQDPVLQNEKLIEGLDTLRADLQKVIDSNGVSRGLQHLRALCQIWKANALLDSVLERSGSPVPFPVPSRAVTAAETVESDLLMARQIFHEVCEESNDFAWLAISRLGRNGLLNAEAASRLIAVDNSHGTSPSAFTATAYAKSMLSLCELHHNTLQAAVIQYYGTPQYEFVTDHGYLYSTAHKGSPSEIWHHAEEACHEMGLTDLAVAWIVRESTDFLHGRQRRTRNADERQSRKLADDAPLMLATVHDPKYEQYVLQHARPATETSLEDINHIVGFLPSDIHPASFVLFSRGNKFWQGKDSSMVRIYAVKSQGRATRHIISDQEADVLESVRNWTEMSEWDSNIDTALAGIWALAKGITEIVDSNELLVLVPGPLCLGIRIHALSHDLFSALWWRNTIVYAPSPSLFRDCIQRALAIPPSPSSTRAVVAGVEEQYSPKWPKNYVHEAAEKTARALGCDPLIGSQVTRNAMGQAFAQNHWIFFIGHGHGGLDDESKVLHEPRLLLTNPEYLFESDFRTLVLPASHIELIACGSGQFRLHAGLELSSLAETLLVRGGVTVLGTMVEAEILAGIQMLELMGKDLAATLKSEATTWNVAKALRDSALALTKTKRARDYWGPFFIQGSPVIALAGRR